MPSLSDHVRRDAYHAARSDIRVEVSRFVRRFDELAKAYIESANADEISDGTALGREAAAKAIGHYIVPGEPQPILEAGAVAEEGEAAGT